MIKIDFEITQNGYTFKDAIHLPEDHQYTEAEIEAMKQARFDNWYAVITAPPAEETTEEAEIVEEQPAQE
jgi:hypothetical protein